MKKLNDIVKYNFRFNNEESLSQLCFYRYFPSFERLVSFLKDGIYMCRADKFSDNLECINKDVIDQLNSSDFDIKAIARQVNKEQKKHLISCWYFPDSNHENELMWKSYASSNNTETGFLVKINSQYFIKNISNIYECNKDRISNLIYGNVRYFDFNDKKSIQKVRFTSFRKHICFKDEREFRLVIKDENKEKDENVFLKLPQELLDKIEIYAQPNCVSSDFEKFSKELNGDFGKELKKSDLHIWYNLRESLNNMENL